MKIDELLDIELLNEMTATGYVNVGEHESGRYFIYNYSHAAQYDRVWNDVTLTCRGLIVAADGRVLARPFAKFFNMDEHSRSDVRWRKPFVVNEKMDGSLGILWYDDLHQPNIATRGSFHSEQAEFATGFIQARFDHLGVQRRDGDTHLFEIIYPRNRIVVDYGGRVDLVYLASIDIETGRDVDAPEWVWSRAPQLDVRVKHPRDLKAAALERGLAVDDGNNEGFVLTFDVGKNKPHWRVKVKLDEYVRLHRILTNTSTKTIWQHLSEGHPLEELLDAVPDEFYTWVHQVVDELHAAYDKINDQAHAEYTEILNKLDHTPGVHVTRKDFAALALQSEYKDLLFSLLDGKSLGPSIWKRIKPEYSKPFVNGEDE